MIKTRIAIILGLVLYAGVVVLPWQAQLKEVCGEFNEGSPAYARCQLALEAGESEDHARAAAAL